MSKAFFLIFFWCCFICEAEPYEWKWIGPYGGLISSVIPDRQHPQIWYAVSAAYPHDPVLYRSTDNTTSWKATGIRKLGKVLVHPLTSRLLTMSIEDGRTIFRESRNYGLNFRTLSTLPPGPKGASDYSVSVAQDPNSENFLATYRNNFYDPSQSVFLSSDGGHNWRDISAGIPILRSRTFNGCKVYDADFRDIVFSPIESQAIYISAVYSVDSPCEVRHHYAMLVSRDLGNTWSVPNEFNDYSADFRVDPYFPDRVFVSAPGQTFIITASGLQQLTDFSIGPFTSFPENKSHLLTDGPQGFIESFDGGITWNKFGSPSPIQFSQLLSMKMPGGGLLALADFGGIYKKIPGEDWQPANRGIRNTRVSAITATGSYIYALLGYNQFLYRSADYGKTWTDLSFQLPKEFEIQQIGVNPNDPSNIILAGHPNPRYKPYIFYASLNSGQSWKEILRLPYSGSFLFHPSQKDVVYMFTRSAPRSTLYKSVNKGLSPLKLPELPIGFNEMVINPSYSKIFFFVNCSAVYKSIDAGKTVEQKDWGIEEEDSCIAHVSPVGRKDEYFATDGYSVLYRTIDGGRKWTAIWHFPGRYGGGFDPAGDWRIFSADSNGKHFFALDRTLFESLDAGKQWREVKPKAKALVRPFDEITDLSVAENHPIYVATDQGILASN